MENTFIVRYRRALRELQEAYRLQYALIDESDDLRTLAYQQAEAGEKAIMKNRKSGRGFLISRLRECLDEEPRAWAITQHLKRDIEEMEANGYDSEIDNEQNRSLYYVIDDAIVVLLDVLGSQYPNKLTTMGIATYRGIIPLSEVILKFGSVPLKRIVKQRLQSATCNITPPVKSAQPHDTPAASTTSKPIQPNTTTLNTPAPTVADLCRLPFEPANLNELLVRLKVISPAGTCLTNDLRGKAQGIRAAFTAAYRVLHRAGLLQPVVADKIWATAFLQAYGAKLGKGAILHKLTAHGTAFTPAPLPFTEAVNITREWVNEWQNRR